MKRTDFDRIAERYDENPLRLQIPRDEIIAELLDGGSEDVIRVLDLACGTGNYLAAQARNYEGRPVVWFGLDASEAMLAQARAKNSETDLRLGHAEDLPYESGFFDYVTCSFAFHHFEDKPQALDEMTRVLRSTGVLQIRNAAPGQMAGWWIYQFFPEALAEDDRRFWPPTLLFHELERRGFIPDLRIESRRYYRRLADILADAERRDTSQLAILPEAAYARGLARLRALLAVEPEGRWLTELAQLWCTGRRTGVSRPSC